MVGIDKFTKKFWKRVLEAFIIAFVAAAAPLFGGIMDAVQTKDIDAAKKAMLALLFAGIAAGIKAGWLLYVTTQTPPENPPTREELKETVKPPPVRTPASKKKQRRR